MTTYSSVIYAKTATFSTGTDTVNFTSEVQITVVNHSTTDYLWVSSTAVPTVEGDDCIPVPPSCSVATPWTSTQIKLISGGTPKYTVIAS